jgi:hypothetical protein
MSRLYDINVRAIVQATRIDPMASGAIEGWEEYSFEAVEYDANGEAVEAIFRIDQLVGNVDAGNVEDAVEAAMAETTEIMIEGWVVDSVKLWVDLDNEDVVLVQQPMARRP